MLELLSPQQGVLACTASTGGPWWDLKRILIVKSNHCIVDIKENQIECTIQYSCPNVISRRLSESGKAGTSGTWFLQTHMWFWFWLWSHVMVQPHQTKRLHFYTGMVNVAILFGLFRIPEHLCLCTHRRICARTHACASQSVTISWFFKLLEPGNQLLGRRSI